MNIEQIQVKKSCWIKWNYPEQNNIKQYHICNVKSDILHVKSYANLQNEWFTFQKIARPSPRVENN